MKESSRSPLSLDQGIAAIVLALLLALFGWWGWRDGAFFGAVFFPGAIGLFAILAVLLVGAPLRVLPRGPALVAIVALAGLAAWMALSLLWTSGADNAPLWIVHAIFYVALFGVGYWVAGLLGDQRRFALLPVALAAAGIGVAATIVLASGTDLPNYFHEDATMRLPIGYRNADAAFFLIAVWPLLALAAEGLREVCARALAVGAATMLLELAVLCQSRGSIPATGFALLVFLAASRRRVRAAVFVALAVLPMLPALPALLAIYQHGKLDPALIGLMRNAAEAIALTSVASFFLAAFWTALVEPRLRIGEGTARRGSQALGILAAAVVVVAAAVFFAQRGGPVHFVDQRLNQFEQNTSADLEGQGARFGVNVESHRSDFWRVAWHQGLDRPLLGGGVGSFEFAYLKNRHSYETPKDPHNVEMLMFGELGVPGILLWVCFVLAAFTAAILARRRLGQAQAALAAGALGGAGYWVFHCSYDWLWNYPAVTAPAIFLLGAAAVAGPWRDDVAGSLRGRLPLFALAVLAAIVAVPLFLSDRYLERGLSEFPSDAPGALVDLNHAAALDPFAVEPLIYRGVDAAEAGASKIALESFRRAERRQPENFAPHYYLAALSVESRPRYAAAELARARQLNPGDPQVRKLSRELAQPGKRRRRPNGG